MLEILPLLVSDPSLPEELRRALADEPEQGARQLVELGLSCLDAAELAGVPPTDICCC